MPIMPIMPINKAMGLMIDSLRLKMPRPGAGRSVSLRGESSFTKAGEGAGSTKSKKPSWQGPDSSLQSAGGGLDDYCTPIEPYHIDNKSFRRIVKTALTRF